jgi:hypothetical protein
MTLSPVLLQEQPAVIFLLEGVLVSWSLAMDERGGHEDLCGSGHQSIIPYSSRGTYIETQGPTDGSEVVETLYKI